MQCFVCGEPMRVVKVEPHDLINTPGFELRTFQCVGCGDVEKRMCFESSRPHRAAALVPETPVTPEIPPVRETLDGSANNNRVKAILGSLVRLRGGRPGA
jgi:hypothetical protein